MKVYRVEHILTDLQTHIKNKTPWSLTRMGDAGLKVMHAVIFNDKKQLKEISDKEGIPIDKIPEILNFWIKTLNISNYIDSAGVYGSKFFWPRTRSNGEPMHEKTRNLICNWKRLYDVLSITNESYCNPEFNFLSCLDSLNVSLPDVMKCKNICCITSLGKELKHTLAAYSYHVDVLRIEPNSGEQYKKSFDKVLTHIGKSCKDYDLWLVAAGELGRIYGGVIKSNGGISLDIGSVVDYWVNRIIPIRLKGYVKESVDNGLKISLKKDSISYGNYI
jgi:hypothetical protein